MTTRWRKQVFACCALLLCTSLVFADGFHDMKAAIVDQDGQMLLQVKVTAYSDAVSEPVRGEQMADGTWFIPGLGNKATLRLKHPVLGSTTLDVGFPVSPGVVMYIIWDEKIAEARIIATLPDPDPVGLKRLPSISPSPLGYPTGPRDILDCPGDSLFAQPAHAPADGWSAGTSEIDAGGNNYLRAESFTGGGEITDIHWWGLMQYLGADWENCTESDPEFEIKFYDDAGGAPGTEVCSYLVYPTMTATGLYYHSVYQFELILFSVDPLSTSCMIDEGWVSIQGLGDTTCWFMWMTSGTGDGSSWFSGGAYAYDNSLCLTGVYVPTYGACCDDGTATCNDDVEIQDCPPPLRFAADTDCVDLDPACGDVTTCDHTIVLTDDYGDGWNGGNVVVKVNTITVLSVTLASGAGPETHVFQADTGDTIDTVYTPGSWAYENEYHIYDVNSFEICADGVGGVEPTGGFCGLGNCGGDPCDGNWPVNDECVDATPVSGPYPQTVSGSNYCATVDCPGVLDWNATWFAIDLPGASNILEISFCGNGYEVNHVGAVVLDDCANCAGYILYNTIDWYDCPDYVTAPILTWEGLAGPATVYFPVMFNYGSTANYTIEINVTELVVPDNDLCENAEAVACPSTTPGTTQGAGVDLGLPECDYSVTAPGVWYSVTGTGNTMTASLCGGATWDTKLTVFCVDCADLMCVEGNDDACGVQSEVVFCSQYMAEYYILVHGYSSNYGPFDLAVWDDGTPCTGAVKCLPEGACCLLTGECVVMPQMACEFLSGDYHGDDSNCGIMPIRSKDVKLPSLAPAIDWTYGASSGTRDVSCPAGSLFDQPATPSTGGWTAAVSDERDGPGGTYGPLIRYESFSGGGEICDVHFWGLVLECCWYACSEQPMDFEIVFYNDDAGAPGAVAYGPYDVTLWATDTGENWAGYTLYEFATILDPCASMASGWVSIQATSVAVPYDCWFLWASSGETGFGSSLLYDVDLDTWTTEDFDLSLCLTGVPQYGACCDDYTGICEDDVASMDCTGRFAADTLCVDMYCGTLGACCVDFVCVETNLESDCDALGGSWYEGEDCDAGFECPLTCEHSITMWDSYGDGWNGCTIDVYVNGSPVLVGVTITYGSGPETVYFDAATGDTIFVDFTSVSYPTETSYCVYDIVGMELGCATGGYNPGEGDLTVTGNCEMPEIAGACCLPDDSCIITIESCCIYAGGVFVGEYTDCGTGTMAIFTEDFNAGIPGDWTIIDDDGSGLVWTTSTDNDTGGDGLCAIASSDAHGSASYDTSLITPNIDLSAAISATLDLECNFQNFAGYDWFYIYVSYDKGVSWTTLLAWNEDHGSFGGPPGEHITLPLSGGSMDCLIRFRYYDPVSHYNWWVMVDDVVITAEVEGLSPCQDMDIKPGSCPNSYNRTSNGVLPVALVGTEDFDASMVDISTLLLSRVDGVGDSVAPHEGPPGPKTVIEDVASPFDGIPCDCHELTGDGIDDVSMKFKTVDVVAVLELAGESPGALIELVLSGFMIDGTPFIGRDCIRLVPPGTPPALLSVTSNQPGAWINASPLDSTLDGGGFCDFERIYPVGSVVTLSAPPEFQGKRFMIWKVDGQQQGHGQQSLDITITEGVQAVSLEAMYLNISQQDHVTSPGEQQKKMGSVPLP